VNTKLRYSLATVLCSLMFVLVAGPLAGQAPTGTLRGTVLDVSGARISGAQVTITDDATATQYTTQTGSTGEFLIGNLNAGSYTVTITKPQFRTGVYKDVKIVVSETYTLTTKLAVGATTESVEVRAGAEVIQTESPTVGISITVRSITELPFTSRSSLDLATLTPGAASTGSPRHTSLHGLPRSALHTTYHAINPHYTLLPPTDLF